MQNEGLLRTGSGPWIPASFTVEFTRLIVEQLHSGERLDLPLDLIANLDEIGDPAEGNHQIEITSSQGMAFEAAVPSRVLDELLRVLNERSTSDERPSDTSTSTPPPGRSGSHFDTPATIAPFVALCILYLTLIGIVATASVPGAIGLAVAAIVGVGLWMTARRRTPTSVPPEHRQAVEVARDRWKQYRQAQRAQERRLKAAKRQLADAEDAKGRLVQRAGGITLYERWINTPQGGGSLVGITATATDETGIRQRITVTRMVTLGVFSLAAPKKHGTGNAYVVIEGPAVTGVATIPGARDKKAGPKAHAFAAKINNLARAADTFEQSRPKLLADARAAIAAAGQDVGVEQARARYAEARLRVPAEHRSALPYVRVDSDE